MSNAQRYGRNDSGGDLLANTEMQATFGVEGASIAIVIQEYECPIARVHLVLQDGASRGFIGVVWRSGDVRTED